MITGSNRGIAGTTACWSYHCKLSFDCWSMYTKRIQPYQSCALLASNVDQ
jgi:hypothetical protein